VTKLFFVGVVLFSSFAFARGPRPSSLKELVNDVKSFAIEQGDGRDAGTCSLKLTLKAGKLKLAMTSQNQGNIVFGATADSKIVVASEKTSSDGSFDKTYVIDGSKVVNILNVDDAYFSVGLSDGSKSITCEVDF